MGLELYEDRDRKLKDNKRVNKFSPYCDMVYYESSVTPGLKLAMRVLKPEKPSYILAGTHGWHMSIPDFEPLDHPKEGVKYLTLQVDMRGRAFSDGNPDCNGWELYDIIDAVNYARQHYKEFILDPETVYFESGSGGGGNAYSILGKFPDFFAAATALFGISDYGMWYQDDEIGEFRDELEVWIGGNPESNRTAYESRSGIHVAENLITPLFIAHGETDIRVPVTHARKYLDKVKALNKMNLVSYMELEGVGTRDHTGNASKEQLSRMAELSETNRSLNRVPLKIPPKGKFTVAGYLFTKEFSIVLDDLNKIAVLEYDLEKNKFDIRCSAEGEYK